MGQSLDIFQAVTRQEFEFLAVAWVVSVTTGGPASRLAARNPRLREVTDTVSDFTESHTG